MQQTGTERVKRGMAEIQKGGVIMDVVNAEQAKVAEAAGAVAVVCHPTSGQRGALQGRAIRALSKKWWMRYPFR